MRRDARAPHLMVVTTGRALAFGTALGLVTAGVIVSLHAFLGHSGLVLAFVIVPLTSATIAIFTAQRPVARSQVSSRVILSLLVATGGTAALANVANEPDVIKCTLVPLLACAQLIELRTRRDARPVDADDERARNAAIRLAMLLGALTTVAAYITEALTNDPDKDLITLVAGAFLPLGLLAGAALGAPFGALAHATRTDAVWVRRLALSTIAAEVVFALATLTSTRELLAPALAATVAGCLYLEHRTRATPILPPATTC